MRQPGRKSRLNDTVLLSGWVFADLLLALAVLFLSANTVGVKPTAIPTPTPVITPTASPSEPRLDFNPVTIPFKGIDYNGLLSNNPQAVNDFKDRMRQQSVLQGRSVGLALVYAGAPSDNDIKQAYSIADKIYAILKELGQQGFAFQRSSYYSHLYVLGEDPGTITIDVYLFKQ